MEPELIAWRRARQAKTKPIKMAGQYKKAAARKALAEQRDEAGAKRTDL